ncbi:hypothetical protein TNCV_836181 [Trichonephila clavipes]|nr:hypothetical protein TNCV_836181 [Trichonephila clavipes]
MHSRTTNRSSLEIKVTDSWLAGHEFKPSTAEDPLCRWIHAHGGIGGRECADVLSKKARVLSQPSTVTSEDANVASFHKTNYPRAHLP